MQAPLLQGPLGRGLATAILLAAGRLAAADPDADPPVPRFSTAYMDPAVSPRVDFANYAAGAWYRTTEIPADKSSWGSFNQLDLRNFFLIRHVLEDAAVNPGAAGTLRQQVGDFYASALDTAAIDAAGMRPLEPDFARIAAVASVDDLIRVAAGLHTRLVAPPYNPSGAYGAPSTPLFGRSVQADQKRSDTYILYLSQGGLGLPTRDYYLDPGMEKLRAAYQAHIEKMLLLAGEADETARADAATALAVEKDLAAISKTPVEVRDPIANYHKMSIAAMAAACPGLPVQTYFTAIGYPAEDGDIVVRQPEFFAGLGRLLQSRSLADWKTYLRWRALSDAAPYLARPFEDESFRFNGTVLNGVPAMEPRWQRVERVLNAQAGQAVGRLYVDRYFPPAVQARLADLVANIEASMRTHLEQADWMSAPTRERALAKFARFRALIAYPPHWRDYTGLEIRRDRYFENLNRAGAFEVRRQFGLIGKKVDRDEFGLSPQIVNAYFQSNANQIVFLAGILQPPFFDPALDDAVNYGGIGTVIGHEITHGFDDRGRLYDADGNLQDWWTPADAAAFQARAQKVIDEFNRFEALPGLPVNGQLTLSENIADLGGVAVAYDALERTLAGKPPPPKIDGFTPEQRFFLAFAQLWRTKFREDALRRQVLSNEHAPGQFRAIGPLVNLPQFYAAFGIGPGDPMWRPPELRAKIW